MNTSARHFTLEGQTPQSAFSPANSQREGLLRHFGFGESPFGVTPNPEFLFWSQTHNAAMEAIIASIESNLGFSVLLGKPGTGKTTILFHLLSLYRQSARTAFIFQTQCKPRDLLRHVASEFELPVTGRDDVSLHQELNEMLIQEAGAGRKVLIVIDEAQNLQAPSLEAIRLLSDFETNFSKLLHVVLSGSPQLGQRLQAPDLVQLAQRITTISRLEPLTEAEVKDYVGFRLAVVASRGTEGLFSPESLVEIASQSQGIPRVINSICYQSLLLAYAHGQASVSTEFVKEAVRKIDLSTPSNPEDGDFKAAIQPPKAGYTPVSQSVPFPMPPGRSELWRSTHTQTFEKTARVAAVNAKGFVPTTHSPQPIEGKNVNLLRGQPISLKAQPVSTKADQDHRIRERENIGFARPGYFRSIELIAVIAIFVLGSWIGWNELRTKPGRGSGVSSRNQAELSSPEGQPPGDKAEVQPSSKAGEVTDGATQASVQSDLTAAPATNPGSHPSPRIQVPPSIDARTSSLLPSKIRSPASTPAETPAPNSLVSISTRSDELAPLVGAAPPALPRLEAPEPVGTSKPKDTFSPRPIRTIQPEYPVKAKLYHIEGAVELELTISPDGKVEKVRALSGNSILLQAAEAAVLRWKYSPSTGDQNTAAAITRVQFNFKLNPEARKP
jgi:TonB family protein